MLTTLLEKKSQVLQDILDQEARYKAWVTQYKADNYAAQARVTADYNKELVRFGRLYGQIVPPENSTEAADLQRTIEKYRTSSARLSALFSESMRLISSRMDVLV